jgi:hypothetical protein
MSVFRLVSGRDSRAIQSAFADWTSLLRLVSLVPRQGRTWKSIQGYISFLKVFRGGRNPNQRVLSMAPSTQQDSDNSLNEAQQYFEKGQCVIH